MKAREKLIRFPGTLSEEMLQFEAAFARAFKAHQEPCEIIPFAPYLERKIRRAEKLARALEHHALAH
jgi:hypothetical protein